MPREQLSEHVAYEVRNRVAHLTLTRPDSRNALSPELARGLLEGVGKIAQDRAVRVAVVAGEGAVFCAGGDLKAFAQTSEVGAGLAELVHQSLLKLHRSPVPVIAAIQGAAVGYGVGLASACDLRLAAAGTRFQAGFTGIGLSPDSLTSYFLPRLLGPSRARAFMLLNLPWTAEQMLAAGYLVSVHPPEELPAAVDSLAQRLAAMPAGALHRAKNLLEQSLENDAESQVLLEVEAVLKSFASADFREGVSAFVEKRNPDFAAERSD